MTSYNATMELAARVSEKTSSALIEHLADYHPAAGRGISGRQEVTITLQAENLRQAISTALAVVAAAGFEPWSVQVLPTDEFDRRRDLPPLPELLSVTEAAAELGVSRQAVQQRIDAGSLPAQKIGSAYAIPRSAVR